MFHTPCAGEADKIDITRISSCHIGFVFFGTFFFTLLAILQSRKDNHKRGSQFKANHWPVSFIFGLLLALPCLCFLSSMVLTRWVSFRRASRSASIFSMRRRVLSLGGTIDDCNKWQQIILDL
jgi:hypothetical protein